MRILTVRQPWAWAIIHGGKDVENRVRNIAGSYRGPVAIHAGLAVDTRAVLPVPFPAHCARGEIVGIVDLVDIHESRDCYDASMRRAADLFRKDRAAFDALPARGPHGGLIARATLCSEWAEDDVYHLALANPRPLAVPIPFKGALGLRTLDDDTTARVLAATP